MVGPFGTVDPRNLDLLRKGREGPARDRSRHVCETVHCAMKRWMNFDLRGLVGET